MNRQDWALGAGTLAAGLAIGALAVNTRIYPPGSAAQRPPKPCEVCPSPTPEPTPDPSPSATPTPSPTPSPTPTPVPTPTPMPPLLVKAEWEQHMKDVGRTQCEAEKKAVTEWKAGTTGVDPCMSYYDGEEVFWNIFNYVTPSDPYWKDCSQVVEQCYRGMPPPAGTQLPNNTYGYVYGNDGKVPGYWIFTGGMKIDFDKTQDVNSKTAIFKLSENGSYCADGGYILMDAGRSREVAYCHRAALNAEILGHAHRTRQDQYVDWMYAHMDSWVRGTYRAPNPFTEVPNCAGMYYLQSFMVGLTMRSQILQYEFKPDMKLYDSVKSGALLLQAKMWDPNSKAFAYENCAPTLAEMGPKPGAPDLNMLIVPAYAWLYSIDHDVSWITFADQAFEGGVKGAWLGGMKQFNQNYTWSFDYLKWRGTVMRGSLSR